MASGPVEDALGLESLNVATAPTFPALLETLYTARYTGSITLHFAGGIPRAVVLSQPVQIPLDTHPPSTPS